MAVLSKTLEDANFDGVFTEVNHAGTLGLINPNQIRMFHLNIESNAFSPDDLQEFLLDNIGQYVFSRAEIDKYITDGRIKVIAAKAIKLLMENKDLSPDFIEEQLGDILLYTFLEQVLEAPKIFTKVELLRGGAGGAQVGGGVHLLTIDGVTTSYQLVYGKSHVIGDMQDAIDEAFVRICDVAHNKSSEKGLLENKILSNSFDAQTTKQLTDLILPSKAKKPPVDKAFGIFLGYSLGLDPTKYTSDQFRAETVKKMNTDIKAHVDYIRQKITSSKLSQHSFYFYILPFNDADNEKKDIMNALLGG